MTQYELESRWTSAQGFPGVRYRFGDLVRVRSGEHSGQTAEVIALMSVDPEPTFGIIMPPDEKFAVLLQSELEPTGSSTGRTITLVPPPKI